MFWSRWKPRVASLVAPALVWAWVPLVPTPAHAVMTRAQERELGRQVVAQVRQQYRLLDDPYLDRYLAVIGGRIAEVMGDLEFKPTFHVVADPRINAFAVPGGHIFVTSETILQVSDESELAGVVAHELGHVEGRHIANRAEKSSMLNLVSLAAVLAGAFLGMGQAGAAVSTFGLAGAQAQALHYSRQDEEDADRRAVRVLSKAGFDGWGLVRFMDTLHRAAPTPDGVPAYLFTHPLPENRSTYLAVALPPPDEEPPARETGYLWRAKARVLVQDPRPWGVAVFRQRVKTRPEDAGARLGLALLLRQQGRYDEAARLLDEAVALAPDDPEIHHERAVTALKRGQADQALAELETLRRNGTITVPALRDLGWMYLEADRGADALTVYDALAKADPRWPRLPYYRGLALGKSGRGGEGHALLGDYYRAQGRLALAEKHYRRAMELLPPGPSRDRVAGVLHQREGGAGAKTAREQRQP